MIETKVVLVTGAATGIGRACAERLADDGMLVAANYRSKKEEIDRVMSILKPGAHLALQGDISKPEVAPGLIDTIVKRMGKIDILVNSAGTFEEHDITVIDYQSWIHSWKKNLDVNLQAPMNLAFCAAQQMMKQGSGTIINITARGAFRGEPDAPAYGASKSGLNSASQSLAKALAPHGISVFAIAPGWIETPLAAPYINGPSGAQIKAQSPLNRVGTPEEIAHLVAFLAGGRTEYLTGAIFDANGASYLRN